jgi:Sulfatase
MAAPPELSTPPLRARVARLVAAGTLLGATLSVAVADLDGNGSIGGTTASWILFVTASMAVVAAAIRTGRPYLARTVALIIGLYSAACLALAVARQLWFLEWSDIEFVLAAPGDSARTFVEMGGAAAVTGAVAVCLLATFAFGASLATLSRGFARAGSTARLLLIAALLAAGVAYAGAPHSRLSNYPKEYLAAGGIMPVVAARPYQPFTTGENVFIVQMESVNGLAVSGDYVIDGKPVTGDFLPGTSRLAPRGISIPYLWSNDILTYRGQQSILCGAVGNLHAQYFDELVPRTTDCLPELFRRAGYRTIFLSNYWNGDFSWIDGFMKRIGFRELHYADFMQPNDPASVWGFDEKIFFDRAFDFLESHYRRDEKLFVYIAISTHHVGFTRERLSDLRWLQADHATQVRQYLQSARIQDESLLTFYSRFEKFTGGDAHAFFVADHGYPLGLYGDVLPAHGSTIDNYLAPLLYLPPTRRADEFALGRRFDRAMYAQSDLLPTIAELLSGKPHQNSFVPFMKRRPPEDPAYEPCHVMVQPMEGKTMVIARGQNLYEYSSVRRTLREYRITLNPIRQVLVSQRDNMTYADFDRTYGCDRYRKSG